MSRCTGVHDQSEQSMVQSEQSTVQVSGTRATRLANLSKVSTRDKVGEPVKGQWYDKQQLEKSWSA